MEQKERKSHELEIDIIPILKALVSKLWLIILIGVIAGGSFYCVTKVLVKPVYRSSFTAYINNKQSQQGKDSLTNSDLAASQQLTRTYSYMLLSDSVLTASAKALGLNMSYESLRSKVSTEIQTDTEIIAVYVVDADPQFAYDLATSISRVAPGYMADFVEGSSMKIIDHPVYSDRRYKPSYIKYGILGFLIGALLMIVILIIQYFKDDTIKSEAEIEQHFPYPVLGIIPDMMTASSGSSDYYYYAQDKTSSDQKRSIQ